MSLARRAERAAELGDRSRPAKQPLEFDVSDTLLDQRQTLVDLRDRAEADLKGTCPSGIAKQGFEFAQALDQVHSQLIETLVYVGTKFDQILFGGVVFRRQLHVLIVAGTRRSRAGPEARPTMLN